MGKKHYSDAIECYTRAINHKALGDFLSNRAHVNILLGNFRRAISDAEEAIKLSPTNVKVPFYFLGRLYVWFCMEFEFSFGQIHKSYLCIKPIYKTMQ